MNEIQLLQKRVTELENIIKRLMKSDRLTLSKDLSFDDGRNIIISSTNGTKIGQSTSRIGFFGATPVAQQAAETLADNPGATYNQAEVTSIASAVNGVIQKQQNLGLMAT